MIFRRTPRLQAILIVLLSVGAYWNTAGNDFVWDDRILIVENDSIKHWNELGANFASDFFHFGRSPLLQGKQGYYRPLVTLSYMADYAVWKLNPLGYHLTNLLFHILNGLLVLWVAVRLLGNDKPVPLLTAALFAVHPIHTESVTWISGRTDPMAATFFLASVYSYLRASSAGALGGERLSRRWSLLSVAMFGLAVLAKETALVLPAVLLAYELCMVPKGTNGGVKRIVWRIAPFLAIAAIYLPIRFLLLGVRAPVNHYAASMGTYAIALTGFKALGLYVTRLLAPWPLNAYYNMPFSHTVLDAKVLLPLLALAGLLVVFSSREMPRTALFALLFFGLTLLPVSNLIPIGAPKDMGFLMAERFLYLPSVGFCLLAAQGICRLLNVDRAGYGASAPRLLVVVAPLVGVLLALTLLRNRDWRDELTFYQDALAKSPFASLFHYNLGVVYRDRSLVAQSVQEASRWLELTEQEMREAIRHDESIAEAHNNLGNLLFVKEDRGGAVGEWRRAVALDPGNFEAWYNMAGAFDQEGRSADAREAYLAFLRSVPPDRNDLIREVQDRMRVLTTR